MERERIIEALKICDSNYDGVVCKKCPIKDEDYNGSWYDKDGSCYQHLMREAAELLSEQPDTTSDLISKQTVSSWLKQYGQDVLHGKYKFSLMYIWKNLMDLPSAQPEMKKGHFIGTEFDGYADGSPVYYEWECSECGCVFEDDEPTYNYCPNCGAKMVEK